jgi:NADP-dependent 3-hydroxy acid dehydrogenase YdfG
LKALADKVAVVTGASRGIGRALCLKLAAVGVYTYAGARNVDELRSLEREIEGIYTLPLDVRDPESVRAFAEAVLSEHDVDIVVNNAGVGAFAPIEKLTLEDWDYVFEINVRGTFLVTQVFLPSVRAQRGHIVNVTSDVSARTFANGSLYTASKHAQRAFTRALQMEVEGDGVRVTEVRPGVVATYFGGSEPQAVDERALAPEDVADAILYALSRPSRMRLDELHFHPMGQKTEF